VRAIGLALVLSLAAGGAHGTEAGAERIAFLAHSGDYWQVWVMDPDGGGQHQVTRSSSEKTRISWFPDGEALLVNTLDGRLLRVNAMSGAETPIQVDPPGALDAVLSADGSQIAFSLSTASSIDANEIWTVATAGGQARRRTNRPWLQHDPQWSPDSRFIYFLSGRGDDSHDIWRLELASGSVEQLTVASLYHFEVAVGPRGALAFSSNRAGHYDLWLQRPPEPARALTDDAALDGGPSWSGDGSALAFHSTRSGTLQIWRADALAQSPPRFTQLTHHAEGARGPAWWSRRGRTL
jgi:Tol biopolymer transport system component